MNIEAAIKQVSAGFAKLDRMDPSGPIYQKLCEILDSADDDALKAAYEANIKFVSKLAFNRMLRRGLVETAAPLMSGWTPETARRRVGGTFGS